MSIIRVSQFKNAIYGLEADGAFVAADWSGRSRTGSTGVFVEPPDPDGGWEPVPPGAPPLDGRESRRRGMPGPRDPLTALLSRETERAFATLDEGPFVVMVHGFLFDPTKATSRRPEDSDNPHSRLYHFQTVERAAGIRHHSSSWPLGLGFDRDRGGAILAYGWHSTPGFATSLITKFQNFYARAYDNAGAAAWNLLTALHVVLPMLPAGRKADIFCHSLGSRVVIRFLALAMKHGRRDLLARIGRVLILGGAEYVVEARIALKRLGEGGFDRSIEIYNIVSRENDILDKLGENFGPRTFGNSNVIGHNGLDVEEPPERRPDLPEQKFAEAVRTYPKWLDLQIDSPVLATWMRERHGLEVTGDNPESVWDHWYYYTDPGNMRLYNSILRGDAAEWGVDAMRMAGVPARVSRRRSVFGD